MQYRLNQTQFIQNWKELICLFPKCTSETQCIVLSLCQRSFAFEAASIDIRKESMHWTIGGAILVQGLNPSTVSLIFCKLWLSKATTNGARGGAVSARTTVSTELYVCGARRPRFRVAETSTQAVAADFVARERGAVRRAVRACAAAKFANSSMHMATRLVHLRVRFARALSPFFYLLLLVHAR